MSALPSIHDALHPAFVGGALLGGATIFTWGKWRFSIFVWEHTDYLGRYIGLISAAFLTLDYVAIYSEFMPVPPAMVWVDEAMGILLLAAAVLMTYAGVLLYRRRRQS